MAYCRTITQTCAAIAALAATAFASPGLAQVPQNRVQLQVFQVKVIDNTGKQGQVPITFYIDTPNSRSAQAICSVGPRVRDALTTHLRKETYPMDRQGQLDTAGIAEKARPVIEEAVKKENVTGVVVSMDPPRVSAAGSGMFARMGCIGVAEESERSKAKAKNK